MVTAQELEVCSIFACMEVSDRQRFAERAADVRLAAGEWLIREGEQPSFFVVLEGHTLAVKDILGKEVEIGTSKPGSFFGEVPILLLAPAFVAVRAKEGARLARFSQQSLFELIQSSEKCAATILQAMTDRVAGAQKFATETPPARVLIVGTQYDDDCREIRAFLSANRIPYEWVNQSREPERIPVCMLGRDGAPYASPSVVVDRAHWVEAPTVRKVAEALGIGTQPQKEAYDVVVVGAGPAGLAAGVYGASEGLKVLIVEKSACGGQAGTSSRIENYLGFPNGVSGDELSEKALKQAERFGAEIAMTRTVESIFKLDSEGLYCVELDGGDRVTSPVVVLATGVEWRRLEADGVEQFRGRGVYYGASRDESLNIMGKKIFIVGGGNSAGQAAMYFSHYASDVIVLVRGEGLKLTMSQYLIDQIAKQKNIKIASYTEVIQAEGDGHLERVTFRRRPPGEPEVVITKDVDALFVMIGAKADTSWLPAELQRNSAGYICTGRDLTDWKEKRSPFLLETSLPGIFCAGDVRSDSIKRVSSGVGEGSMAIAFVHQYLAL